MLKHVLELKVRKLEKLILALDVQIKPFVRQENQRKSTQVKLK